MHASTFRILKYGPAGAELNTPFNVQPNGESAVWFEIYDDYQADVAVKFDGLPLRSVRNGNIVSAMVPNCLLTVSRNLVIQLIDESRPYRHAEVEFEISGATPGMVMSGLPHVVVRPAKPNFFILGAPRSGTTSMYWRLRAHPDVYMSRIKEPYYFDDRAYGLLDEAILSKQDYMSLFMFAPFQAKVVGEATTTYLSSSKAMKKINEFNPAAKVLIMLRNPLTASLSLYLQHTRGGKYEKAKRFEDAWRECESNLSRAYISNYKQLFLIGDQLATAIEIFGRERLKLMFFDDLVVDSGKIYKELLSFLEIPVDGDESLPISNSAEWKSARDMVSAGLLQEMKAYFRPQIELVADSAGRNLDHWMSI